MAHSSHQIDIGNRDSHALVSCVRIVKPKYIGRAHLQTTVQQNCPSQNGQERTSRQIESRTQQFFIKIICCSFQITENFYCRVVVGDDLCVKKICGGCT